MRYLVVGGGGFIGSYVVAKLIKEKSTSKVIVYDNFCSGKKWHLKEFVNNKKFKLVEKDIYESGIEDWGGHYDFYNFTWR